MDERPRVDPARGAPGGRDGAVEGPPPGQPRPERASRVRWHIVAMLVGFSVVSRSTPRLF